MMPELSSAGVEQMTIMTWVLLAVGLVILTVGAEFLVRGASKVAAAFGVSSLVIGLTVVAYGTSAPELAVSVKSAFEGQSDIAVGNVVGSNIFNVLFILGICALIYPLKVHAQLIRLDVPIMIAVSFLAMFLSLDGGLGRYDGGLLFSLVVIYTVFLIRKSRAESRAVKKEFEEEFPPEKLTTTTLLINLGFVAIGIAFLILGAQLLVNSSIQIAQTFGVSELVIGLTIVAAGTSLPEVATSVVATIRGERDIAIGNVVGSNIFNILSVLGMSSLIKPITVSPAAMSLDIPVMIAVAIACLPIFFTDLSISRWKGLLFLGYYVAYTAYLILNAQSHSAAPVLGNVMLMFVLPLTAVTLVAISVLEWRKLRRPMEA